MKCIKNKGLIVIFFYLLITIYCITKDAIFYTNIINPIFWGIVFLYLIINVKIRLNVNKRQVIYFITIIFITIGIYIALGCMYEFSKTPYSHKIISILKNIIIQIIPIIGIETLRIAIIAKNKNNKMLVVIITILLILLQINYYTLEDLYSNKEELFRYICSNIAPIIIYNIIYSYFILKNMYLFAISYRVLEKLFVLLMPIFPNVDWYVTGSISILLSIFMYLLFKYKYLKEKESLIGKLSYIVTFVLALMLVCFMIGIFKYEPICILSNSMTPVYEIGDVVIFKKMTNYELNNISKDSIIVYTKDDRNIAHRVINIIKTDDRTLYQTKGDSNNTADTGLVQIEQIKGVYIFHIKYIGFPSVWLYKYFHQEESI